ncbi:rRNA maturation RNase YbeY [Ascidiimonas sp. W6]|uniref:rRNA maturation RNase YbeY n=1 Tax=Ascidiimonas meishanensis TaxID=3128903 RepID=UPI0030EB2E6B
MSISEEEISFQYETDFNLGDESSYRKWVIDIITSEKKQGGVLTFIYCGDKYLHEINMQYLNHDTYTDIITFDYSEGQLISGDIFISIERVKDNAKTYEESFDEELKRVMAHGLLHLMGYKDKKDQDRFVMRSKESEKISMFHVER